MNASGSMPSGWDHLAERWTFRLPGERNVSARRPVLTDDTAYVAFMFDRKGLSGSTLFALDAATGAQRWSYSIDHVGNEPLVADGVVYWSSFEGAVHALDREGRLLWKAPGTSSSIGVPVVGGNRLFVSEIAGGARNTWCLDRITGATLWRFAHGGHAYRLMYAGDRLYHTSVAPTEVDAPPRCSLHCLSAADGRVLWSVAERDYLFDPVVFADCIHTGSHRKLYSYSTGDGRRIGETALESESGTVTLGVPYDRLLAWGANDGRGSDFVAAYTVQRVKRLLRGERVEAKRLWRLEEPRGLCDAPIALTPDRLAYLTHDGVMQIVSGATGERLSEWKLKTKRNRFGGLAAGDDRLLVTHGRSAYLFLSGARPS